MEKKARQKYKHGAHSHRAERPLPCRVFLIFLRYEEPDELSVAHPAFSLHRITSGNKRDRAIHMRRCHYCYKKKKKKVPSSVFVYMCVSTYRVTAPENNLSMILFEDAVRGENEKNKQM